MVLHALNRTQVALGAGLVLISFMRRERKPARSESARSEQVHGEFAFDRILKETSAHYLLGVEPLPKDRDGRAHQLRLKVAERGVTVRSRSWVILPKDGKTPAP